MADLRLDEISVESSLHPDSVIVEVNYPWEKIRHKLFFSAELLHYDLVRGVLDFLRSQKFLSARPATQSSYCNYVGQFFEYLDTVDHIKSKKSISLISPDYLEYMRKERKGERSIYDALLYLRMVLDWMVSLDRDRSELEWWSDELIGLRASVDVLPQMPIPEPMPSLSELYPELDYGDEELLLSMRICCAWYLIREQSARDKFHDFDSKLSEEIWAYFGNMCSKYEWTERQRFLKFSKEHDLGWSGNTRRELYGRFIKALIGVNDPILFERFFFNSQGYTKSFLENDYTPCENPNLVLQEWVDNFGRVKFEAPFPHGVSRAVPPKFDVLGCRDIVYPSCSETQAISWILAGDRVQPSGQDALLLDDIRVNKGEVQVLFEKKRNGGGCRTDRESLIYGRNTPIYRCLSSYKRVKMSLGEQIKKLNEDRPALTLSVKNLTHQTNKYSNGSGLGLILLGETNSLIRSECLKHEPKTKPFLDLLQKHVSNCKHRQLVCTRNQSIDDGRWLGKKTKPPKPKSITISRVGRSRVIVDENRDVAMSVEELILDAALTAQSPGTKKNTYKDRARDKTSIRRTVDFGKMVGDEMAEEAKEVSRMLDKTECLTLGEIRKKLNIRTHRKTKSKSDDLELFLKGVDLKKYSIGYASQIIGQNKIYVIQCPMTAALILNNINHISENIRKVSECNLERAVEFLIEKTFLMRVLDRFSQKTRRQGEAIALKHILPLPSLL